MTAEIYVCPLNYRFEEPNSNNRWDSPLFAVQPIDEFDLDAVYRVLFEKKPPPPNMSTQNVSYFIYLHSGTAPRTKYCRSGKL